MCLCLFTFLILMQKYSIFILFAIFFFFSVYFWMGNIKQRCQVYMYAQCTHYTTHFYKTAKTREKAPNGTKKQFGLSADFFSVGLLFVHRVERLFGVTISGVSGVDMCVSACSLGHLNITQYATHTFCILCKLCLVRVCSIQEPTEWHKANKNSENEICILSLLKNSTLFSIILSPFFYVSFCYILCTKSKK